MAIIFFHDSEPPAGSLAKGEEVIVSVDSPERIPVIRKQAKQEGFIINTFILKTPCLGEFMQNHSAAMIAEDVHSDQQNGLIVKVGTMGERADLIRHAESLVHDNLRLDVPLRSDDDALAAMIINSLGARLIFDLKQPELDWDALSDVMIRNFLALNPRPPIDPFHMLSVISQNQESEFSLASVYFDDFRNYLHRDREGRSFLSRDDMLRNKALALKSVQPGKIVRTPEFKRLSSLRRQHLSKKTDCSFCEGFTLCQAYLLPGPGTAVCRKFFREFFENSDLARAKGRKDSKPVRSGQGDFLKPGDKPC